MSEYDPSIDGPSQIGQYEVTSRIGRGSFGVVYKGRDPYLKRDVAIKVCTVDDEHLRQRFYREAEIAGKLEHDHVVAVHAFGFEDEAPYLVQEFLEGQDLSHLIKQRVAWSGLRKLDILSQTAAALAYAHDQGVIHRDVKPANVRVLAVDPEVKTKLMDFGIAKLAHDESQLTQKGVTMGTASYLPPEQVKGGDVDHRGDIFSFGVMAYELFTMERPFRGQTLSALVYQILYKAPKKLEDVWPGCPLELSQWVHRCLQKDPAARFADFHEVIEALAPIREGAAVGQWPALSQVWLPEESSPDARRDPDSSTEVAARSSGGASSPGATMPPKVESVLEDSVGSQTRVVTPGSSRKVDFDATQPVVPGSEARAEARPDDGSDAGAAGEASELEAVDAAATRRIPMPAIPQADGSVTIIPEELRTSAHEISKLVDAGDFEAAKSQLAATMEQLERTIHRQKGIAKAEGVTGVLPMPPDGSAVDAGSAGIDAERPTLEIPRATTDAARATISATAPPPLSGSKSAPQSDPQQPPPLPGSNATADPELSRSDPPQPPALPAGRSRETTVASSTGLPKRTGGKGKLVLLGAVVVVAGILAVVMGWWLGQGRGEQPRPVVDTPPAPEAPETPPETGLVVQSTPWAVVTEVSNADGFTLDLPDDPSTPLYLPLEPGEYTVIVRYPDGNEEQRCEVQVTEEQSATCVTPFTQPTASDYFKDAGWWR